MTKRTDGMDHDEETLPVTHISGTDPEMCCYWLGFWTMDWFNNKQTDEKDGCLLVVFCDDCRASSCLFVGVHGCRAWALLSCHRYRVDEKGRDGGLLTE